MSQPDKITNLKQRNASKGRTIKLSEYSKVNKRIIQELDFFLNTTSPEKLSRNLRSMFLLYLYSENNMLSRDFKEMPVDLCFLLQLLDVIVDEIEEEPRAEMKNI